MILVVDASVAVKWFFGSRSDEEYGQNALNILDALSKGSIRMLQPPHFIAEVASVLARKKQSAAKADLADLLALDFQQVNDPHVHILACDLAVRLDHHLFDTLYHAVALLEPEAEMITADSRYFAKARSLGRITHLADAFS